MINYYYIDRSINYYSLAGFQRIEAPWTVTESVISLTKPEHAAPYKIEHTGKCLVGSAEQSFLYMYIKGQLPKGKFQATTPCFRDELFDATHTKYFIKNELINTIDVTEEALKELVDTAYGFFQTFTDKVRIERVDENSYDIVINNIEVGSYGIRENSFLKYIYGTACAEPRLSIALKSEKWGTTN